MNKQGENADTNKNNKKNFSWKGMVERRVRKTENNGNTWNFSNYINSGRIDYLLHYKCTEL